MTGIGQQSAELSIGSQFSLEMSLAWEGILRWFLKMFRFIGRKRTFGLRTRAWDLLTRNELSSDIRGSTWVANRHSSPFGYRMEPQVICKTEKCNFSLRATTSLFHAMTIDVKRSWAAPAFHSWFPTPIRPPPIDPRVQIFFPGVF